MRYSQEVRYNVDYNLDDYCRVTNSEISGEERGIFNRLKPKSSKDFKSNGEFLVFEGKSIYHMYSSFDYISFGNLDYSRK